MVNYSQIGPVVSGLITVHGIEMSLVHANKMLASIFRKLCCVPQKHILSR